MERILIFPSLLHLADWETVIYIYKHIVRRRKEESFFLQRTERCKERDSLEQERLTVRRSRREEEEGSVGFASSSCCLIIRRKNNKDTHIHTHTKRERERERESLENWEKRGWAWRGKGVGFFYSEMDGQDLLDQNWSKGCESDLGSKLGEVADARGPPWKLLKIFVTCI
jgi:hypothetical protein